MANASASLTESAETLEGIIERVSYHAEESGYTVLRLAVSGERDLVTAVGSVAQPMEGESVRLHGEWARHKEFGRQFQFSRCEIVRPATAAAIEKYLGSGLVKGIGREMARRIVRRFGEQTFDLIEADPGILAEVEGIGPVRVKRIATAWEEQKAVREVMLFLQSNGVSTAYAVRIYRIYRENTIRLVETDPYRLARDIWGIGFKTADRIAANLGFLPASEPRLRAGLQHTLWEATGDGHVFLPQRELLERAEEILGVGETALRQVLEQMVATGDIVLQAGMGPGTEAACFHPALEQTEAGLARRLTELASVPAKRAAEDGLEAWLSYETASRGLDLSSEQKEAVRLALRNRLFVVTGGPGTGKTTVTNLICAAFERRGCAILLASPTGRAAKRLSEVTGRPAQTVHRLLKFDPRTRQFQQNEENPLACGALIADEASMLDESLANSLLRAVPDGAHVVLVGDADQLPSVGAGNVLCDLIASGTATVCRLTQVFRQAARSRIVTNAHRVNQGEFPLLISPKERGDSDCVFVEAEDAEMVAKRVVTIVTRSLPNLGYRPEEIQVLTPMHRGEAGVGALNERLQQALNPPRRGEPEISRSGRLLREGDRVIQMVNNYDRQVFNGDVGTIARIDSVDQEVAVRFPEQEVVYDFGEADQLQLAYALSVHKSQGSEYPAVVLVMTMSHYMMLQRNLLYTALTRARKMCVLVGEKRAIARAVKNGNAGKRYTLLTERLREARWAG